MTAVIKAWRLLIKSDYNKNVRVFTNSIDLAIAAIEAILSDNLGLSKSVFGKVCFFKGGKLGSIC